MKINENNAVSLKGQVFSEFQFCYELHGEKFYKTTLDIERTSGNHDFVPVMVSDRVINVKEDIRGMFVGIEGDFRSRNYRDENGKSHCELSVFVKDWKELEYDENDNQIILRGFICKKGDFRKTPLGREITDVVIAVNRHYGKTDYLPSITWGRIAKFADSFSVGDEIEAIGRIQSRVYQKLVNREKIDMTAYEVSISKIERIESGEM